MLIGNIEVCDQEKLVGWIADDNNATESLSCILDINGEKYPFVADGKRSDLASKLSASGEAGDTQHLKHGFRLDLTDRLKPGDNVISIIVEGYDEPAPFRFQLLTVSDEDLSFLNTLFRNDHLFSFNSELRQTVSKKLAITSDFGRTELRKLIRETKLIFVLFTNRSGSNLVTDMMEQMGVGRGATNEPFLSETILAEAKKWKLRSLDHYLANILTTWTKNGFCFLKLSWDSLSWMMAERILDSDHLHRSAIILTTRRDKILQAISYWKLVNGGKPFLRGKGNASTENSSGLVTPELGEEAYIELVEWVHHMFESEQRLRYLISLFDFDHHEIAFEDMTADLDRTCDELRRYLEVRFGTHIDAKAYNPTLKKQSSGKDLKWKDDFLRQMNGAKP